MAIVQSEKIRSGKPVVQGTRVTVEDIIETFYKLDRSVDEVASDFGIDKRDVEQALRYHLSDNVNTDEATA